MSNIKQTLNINHLTASAIRPRRSLLFMPGDNMRNIRKGTQLAVDSIIMDLEDAVAVNQKAAARKIVVEALMMLDFGNRERLIRINPVSTNFAEADVAETVDAQPDGYVLPKVENGAQLMQVDRWLTEVEAARGWSHGAIRLLGIVETALGVMNIREIATATPRLDALMFGAEDLAGDIGATRTRESWEVFYARSAVVTAAAAYGRQAIDTVFVDLSDLDGLAEECGFVQRLGFVGKMAIHPRQVEIINRAFSPTVEEVAQAQRLLDAFAEHESAGAGVFELDGKMVDMPMVRAATRVLARKEITANL